jgi:hypothetical protein
VEAIDLGAPAATVLTPENLIIRGRTAYLGTEAGLLSFALVP